MKFNRRFEEVKTLCHSNVILLPLSCLWTVLRSLLIQNYIRGLGHGKLMLGDTGYYEGTFVHGEIEGHGFKVFGLSGASYTGQFHQGELHGQGLLMKPHGEQYEGSWSHNSREGQFDKTYKSIT